MLYILMKPLYKQCFCIVAHSCSFALSASENLALIGSTTQSSSLGAQNSYLAVDGNPTSMLDTYSSTLQEAYPWWQVDLGSVKEVAMVVIITGADCCRECGDSCYILIRGLSPYLSVHSRCSFLLAIHMHPIYQAKPFCVTILF